MPVAAPRFIDADPMLLAGLRRVHRYHDAPRTIPDQWTAFNALDPMPGRVGDAAYGVICGSDPERQTFEYMAAIQVASFDGLPADTGRMRVPAQRYAVFTHPESVATIQQTWTAIWEEWLPTSGYRAVRTPDFERYGPGYDRESRRGDIEIWFPVEVAHDIEPAPITPP